LFLKINLTVHHLIITNYHIMVLKSWAHTMWISIALLLLNRSNLCKCYIDCLFINLSWLSNSRSSLILKSIVILYFYILIVLINCRWKVLYSLLFIDLSFTYIHASSLYNNIISQLASSLRAFSIAYKKVVFIWIF
jgi:hypothetical protein